jgi:AcrR family transcriptional regulator
MAWDVEGTKRRIYDAALTEFAEHGPNGTTIDRIARRAKVNRERIYNYFGDKTTLFATVASGEVDKIAKAVPLTIASPADAGTFAGASYDYLREHPELARLTLWEGLTSADHITNEASRSAVYAEKTAAVAAAQRAGLIDDRIAAADLVLLLISLSCYWSAAPHITRMLATGDGHATDADTLRAAVVRAATQLATPRPRA